MSTRDDAGTAKTNVVAEDRSEPGSNGVTTTHAQDAEVDEFGLPIRPASRVRAVTSDESEASDDDAAFHDPDAQQTNPSSEAVNKTVTHDSEPDIEDEPRRSRDSYTSDDTLGSHGDIRQEYTAISFPARSSSRRAPPGERAIVPSSLEQSTTSETLPDSDEPERLPSSHQKDTVQSVTSPDRTNYPIIRREKSSGGDVPTVSEWSHQTMAQDKREESDEEEEVEWQAMPAIDEFDVFDDNGRLIAKGIEAEEEDPRSQYMAMGAGGKGYTRVLDDEDAKSATSMDEDTEYLFQKPQKKDIHDEYGGADDDEERDAMTQLEATKDLLTEGQRIAYVGVVRLTIFRMVQAMNDVRWSRSTQKDLLRALESINKWGQSIMFKLYRHMDISMAEQIMIEQLAAHGVEAVDLVHPLMQNARVKNPMAERGDDREDEQDKPERSGSRLSSESDDSTVADVDDKGHYHSFKDVKDVKDGEDVPEVHGPEDMPSTSKIELDIRWTVLCDLFLILLEGGMYDARSRRLLERVGSALKISWVQICRFEKRVMDQLEMQEADKEDWDESKHIEDRRKRGLRKKYVVMGLATVGGGLVIGLSAGLLAPLIGAGLAAGFTTIGVTGTAGFLGGVGGAALITSAATAAGGTIAVRASHRRTGHVQTFEYRPLHSNKKLNLILTVSGWMTGKVDDVRLPFSTVDPIMGDIYSLFWEPEMLRSMGDTINILATEALTSTIQQVLGSTLLMALMASLQLPIVLTKLAYLIDNPWTVSLDRANSAGLILADSLIARHLGQRPITLLGFSLGARVIFSCLKELAKRNAYGIIQNVYLFGSPIVAKKDEWIRARTVIAGRFVNGYASNDWILGYLFRATSGGIMKVAGLAKVEGIPGLENLDVTELVNGHMAYRAAMPKLLKKVGWEVESEEFTEIEDPDPENHAQRQRELIQEIDEARKQAAAKPEKKRFSLFKRGNPKKKEGWETYEVKNSPTPNRDQNTSPDLNSNILFDIDAIRKELISEQIEIRELDSTMPPIQFTTVQNGEKKVEYLRLPPEIRADEVSKMRLPPRPEDLADPNPLQTRDGVQRASASYDYLPSTRLSVDTNSFDQPRELASTLAPLRISSEGPSLSVQEEEYITRPDLKRHDSEPTGYGYIHPLRHQAHYSDELEDNAWADTGKEKEISMTFE